MWPVPSAPMRATVSFAVATLLIWTTRISNIWNDNAANTASKVASTALALSFTGFAVATLWLAHRRSSALRPVVLAFAGWTTAVWIVRLLSIAAGDRGAAFIAVHAVLAVASVALALVAAHEVRGMRHRLAKSAAPNLGVG
jgi:hypothetical protein